jgi:hypothetical protein
MWGDTLAAVERAHLLRVIAWGLMCILVGTALVAWLHAGRRNSALLRHFGIQTGAWGVLCAATGVILLNGLVNRDLASATRLDRILWLNIGLDVGYVFTGATLIVTGWKLGRRLGLVGAGIGVILQGLALGLLDLVLAAQISR